MGDHISKEIERIPEHLENAANSIGDLHNTHVQPHIDAVGDHISN